MNSIEEYFLMNRNYEIGNFGLDLKSEEVEYLRLLKHKENLKKRWKKKNESMQCSCIKII